MKRSLFQHFQIIIDVRSILIHDYCNIRWTVYKLYGGAFVQFKSHNIYWPLRVQHPKWEGEEIHRKHSRGHE